MELKDAQNLVDGAIAAEVAGDSDACTKALSGHARAELDQSLAIAAALGEGSVTDRRVGAHLLRQVWETQPSPRAIEQTRALMVGEEDVTVIAALLLVLGRTGMPDCLDDVLKHQDHPSKVVRYAVSDSISSFCPDRRAREALLLLARDADEDVRWSAVFELGAWLHDSRHPEILELLTAVAETDRSSEVRKRALDSLCGQ